MRHLFFILLLNVPYVAGAAVYVPANNCESTEIQFSFSKKRSDEKGDFFKRFAEKQLLKRLKKAAVRSGGGDGKWLSISGFAIGLLGILPWIFSAEGAVFVSFAFPVIGLAGLLLSIFGLIKARSWEGTTFIKGLAIAGIVMNGGSHRA